MSKTNLLHKQEVKELKYEIFRLKQIIKYSEGKNTILHIHKCNEVWKHLNIIVHCRAFLFYLFRELIVYYCFRALLFSALFIFILSIYFILLYFYLFISFFLYFYLHIYFTFTLFFVFALYILLYLYCHLSCAT